MTRTNFPHSTRLLWVLLALGLALMLGCGRSVPPEADPEKARSALASALDAWKNGKPFDALHGASPPVYLNDPQWQQGRRLLDYQLEPDSEQRHGCGLRYTVVLSLEDRKGNSVQRKVLYQIHTESAIVITPADL
ncbi:MAG TPA: hypothetical protein VKD72_38180 [Gemmataceae bacterium]|nr:hypothetical protein [Gemmataceae bacterium]